MNEQEQASPLSVLSSAPSVSYPWRKETEIDVERQATLARWLAKVPDVKKECYPFLGEKLSRADIEWLLVTHENGKGPVDWDDRQQRQRKGLDLRGADLRQVDLCDLPLACFSGGLTREEWQRTTLQQRDRAGVHLEGADLSRAHLEGAILEGAHLYGATLRGTLLQGANLFRADLRSTYLREVHLERASLRGTRLEGAYLPNAHLQGADLRNAFFDGASNLEGITLNDEKDGTAIMADVSWGNANLALVDWSRIARLGDEKQGASIANGPRYCEGERQTTGRLPGSGACHSTTGQRYESARYERGGDTVCLSGAGIAAQSTVATGTVGRCGSASTENLTTRYREQVTQASRPDLFVLS